MLKADRKNSILKLLDQQEYVKVADLQKYLEVTEMTIRRDLDELEQAGLLKRVHGGAKREENISTSLVYTELSHNDRAEVNRDKKRVIAKKAAELIEDNDIIFISASTTNELMSEFITAKNVRVVTNCLYIYFQYMKDTRFDSILIGGKFDESIESFLGSIAKDVLQNMNFTKAFIGTNGICGNHLSASNDEEGWLHRIVLDNSKKRYIVCDTSKFNVDAFYNFYTCDKLTGIITNDGEIENKEEYYSYTNVF